MQYYHAQGYQRLCMTAAAVAYDLIAQWTYTQPLTKIPTTTFLNKK